MFPRYPIYIPSRHRSHVDLTTDFLKEDGVPFSIVVEPHDYDKYAAKYGEKCLLTLPEDGRGLVFARNWIFEHSVNAGHERHWQIDDNIRRIRRWYHGHRIPCDSAIALRASEDFTDRYENVAISGLNYTMFAVWSSPPFVLNAHVYSCTLILNSMENRFRGTVNEDVDMCLQVLADGWCTIQFNAFLQEKMPTMVVDGGQTDSAYQLDGRLDMARGLERAWPGVVTVKRRFQRPQHIVHSAWRHFDTPLKRKPGLKIPDAPNEYGMTLTHGRKHKPPPNGQRWKDSRARARARRGGLSVKEFEAQRLAAKSQTETP